MSKIIKKSGMSPIARARHNHDMAILDKEASSEYLNKLVALMRIRLADARKDKSVRGILYAADRKQGFKNRIVPARQRVNDAILKLAAAETALQSALNEEAKRVRDEAAAQKKEQVDKKNKTEQKVKDQDAADAAVKQLTPLQKSRAAADQAEADKISEMDWIGL
jgi:hypothetical protein